jgi:pyruvate/2-oxoglutarate dehydrogenase complex dihydrolipoamide dehydrogenase (E3) component
MRTNVRSIYACGDVAGAQFFTHTAGQQGRVIIQNALMPFKTRMEARVLPSCTFTDPELARVGLNEQEAQERNVPHRVIKVPFSGNDRAVCDEDPRGFLKILTPPGKDDILGATLAGAHAGEIIHEIVLSMQAKLGLKALAGMVHIYPTRAEIVRRAADEARREGFTPRLQKILRGYLSWRRR